MSAKSTDKTLIKGNLHYNQCQLKSGNFQELLFVFDHFEDRFQPRSKRQTHAFSIVKYHLYISCYKTSLTVPSRGPKDELNTKKLTNPGDVFMVAILDWDCFDQPLVDSSVGSPGRKAIQYGG